MRTMMTMSPTRSPIMFCTSPPCLSVQLTIIRSALLHYSYTRGSKRGRTSLRHKKGRSGAPGHPQRPTTPNASAATIRDTASQWK
jgi:hypothetical protein